MNAFTSILARCAPLQLALGLLCLAATPTLAQTSDRPTIDLSGEWELRLDPRDEGMQQRWFAAAVPFPRRVTVPGAWNAQGIGFESAAELNAYRPPTPKPVIAGPGTETNKLFHVYPGPAWYRRTVDIPREWDARRVWLHFGGVHRTADVWVNGEAVGSHVGYIVPFRYDITRLVRAGQSATITVRVDARRNPETDPLMGCVDTLDFLFVQWGGLHRGVQLEATSERWIEDIFVVPRIDPALAEVRVTLGATESGKRENSRAEIGVELTDPDGHVVGQEHREVEAGSPAATVNLAIPRPRLWSPATPHLYRARVSLRRGNQVIDAMSTRFGLREFVVKDGRFLLNGHPIFLRGYGDDCIYPNTIAPPVDREEYRRRFKVVKEYGFNYARHHSWCPPEEYFDVADEMGVMIQPEFPQAYRWELPQTPTARGLAVRLWRQMIITHRNHPSIVTWCMGNELYDGFPDGPLMYRQARELDPSRLVIDSDGVSRKPRETLDFWVWQFAENSLGYRNAKYRFEKQEKPVVAHEMGYFVTLPDLDQLPLFAQGIRPYWLYETRDLVAQKGLVGQYPAWLANSCRLQAECLKVNMEAARRSNLQGYSCWLFQDYPWCAEGVVDMFFRPKALPGAEFQRFNGPTVLLLDHDQRSIRSGELVTLKVWLACDEPEWAGPATFSWQIRGSPRDAPVASGEDPALPVEPGVTREFATIRFDVPRWEKARRVTLEVDLKQGERRKSNAWKLWVFPEFQPVSEPFTIDGLGILDRLYPRQRSSSGAATDGGLRVTGRWDAATLRFLEQGGRVLLLAPDAVFPTVAAGFRPAGWDPSSKESNLGTVFDPAHPALRDIPSEGWCDLQFYSLIEGAKAILLDEVALGLAPIVRCIDMPQRLWNKAFLFEARVGQGRLLVSGFNFAGALESNDPVGAHLLNQLVRYALGSDFEPQQELSADRLQPRILSP